MTRPSIPVYLDAERPTLSCETSRETTRVCVTCKTERSLVLFPRKKNGALRKRCQLCRDTGAKRNPKVLDRLRTRGRRAQEHRQKMLKANRAVSDRSRVNVSVETVGEERETA